MAIFALLNNFMHDFSAAGWLFGAVLLWIARRKGTARDPATEGVRFMVRHIRRLMGVCLVGIVVCGTIRAIAYRQYEWNAAAGAAQVPVLALKHLLLFLVFFAGLYEFMRAGRSLSRKADEAS